MPSVGGLRGRGDVFLPLFPWLQQVVEEGHAEGERVGLIVANSDLARLGGLDATVASFFVAGNAADALDAPDSAVGGRGVGVSRRPRHGEEGVGLRWRLLRWWSLVVVVCRTVHEGRSRRVVSRRWSLFKGVPSWFDRLLSFLVGRVLGR